MALYKNSTSFLPSNETSPAAFVGGTKSEESDRGYNFWASSPTVWKLSVTELTYLIYTKQSFHQAKIPPFSAANSQKKKKKTKQNKTKKQKKTNKQKRQLGKICNLIF